jgi:pimeloyl-ACP methyl ester carboxylesterase
MTVERPNFILYAQHGWADDCQGIAVLASSLAEPNTLVITPSLGYLRTWLRIDPLIQTVEELVLNTSLRHPQVPIRIVGHSLGGLIWLEVLNRHPEWSDNVESLVLVGSPVGGADLARILDPLGIGLGMARDLGVSRRVLAEAIATQIPTLVIAGDIDGGSDGTIPVASTKVFGADFVLLPGVSHAALRNHPAVAVAIEKFWLLPKGSRPEPDLAQILIRRLQQVPGMTDGHYRDFRWAKVFLTFDKGVTLRLWKDPVGISHVFVADPEGNCLYSGFVGWLHSKDLEQELHVLQQEQAAQLI